MQRLLNFFIHGRHLGAVPCPDRTLSHVLTCPECGDVWARLAVTPAFRALESCAWVPLSIACEKHPPTSLRPWPGSILLSEWTPSTKLNDLPPQVIEWEFQRHLKAFELKGIFDESQEST